MKKSIKFAIAAGALVLLGVLGFLLFSGGVSYEVPKPVMGVFIEPRYDVALENPYEYVDWEAYGQHKANLHTHTRNSDGLYSVARVIDTYHQLDYGILAIVEHNYVTWPWQDYRRDPEELGMLAIQANEISDTHHIGSYFSSYNIDGKKYRPILSSTFGGKASEISEEEVIRHIGELGGLAVFFHPGRYQYSAGYYARFYEKFDHLVGMEVVNQRDRYPQDRIMWDNVLTMLMPERPVWGFSNDDMHRISHAGHCYNVFLLPELTEEAFRFAMENGLFYFCNGKGSPSINSIVVDQDRGTITIEASGEWEAVVWISDGMVIHEGDTLPFRNTANIGSYIRAEIIGEGGITYTNPFGVIDAEPAT